MENNNLNTFSQKKPLDNHLTDVSQIVDLKATTEKLLRDSLKNTEDLLNMFNEQLKTTRDEKLRSFITKKITEQEKAKAELEKTLAELY